MNKLSQREFIRRGALFVPAWLAGGAALLLPRKSKAQYLLHRRKAFRSAGGGSVTVANRANSGSVVTSPLNITSFTQATSSPMFVAVVWQGSQTITSVQWKPTGTPEAFTLLDSHVDGASLNRLAVYKLINPSSGTDTIRVTFSANPGSGAWAGVIGTTGGSGHRTPTKRSDLDGTGPGLTDANYVSGDIEFHAVALNASTITWDAGEVTSNTTVNNIVGSGFSGGMSTDTANGTVGCTDVSFYCEIAFAVTP